MKCALGLSESPACDVSIRSVSERMYQVERSDNGAPLDEISEHEAFFQVYPGAIYMHQGHNYEVIDLDVHHRVARVRPVSDTLPYHTLQQDHTDVLVVRVLSTLRLRVPAVADVVAQIAHSHGPLAPPSAPSAAAATAPAAPAAPAADSAGSVGGMDDDDKSSAMGRDSAASLGADSDENAGLPQSGSLSLLHLMGLSEPAAAAASSSSAHSTPLPPLSPSTATTTASPSRGSVTSEAPQSQRLRSPLVVRTLFPTTPAAAAAEAVAPGPVAIMDVDSDHSERKQQQEQQQPEEDESKQRTVDGIAAALVAGAPPAVPRGLTDAAAPNQDRHAVGPPIVQCVLGRVNVVTSVYGFFKLKNLTEEVLWSLSFFFLC